MTTTQPVTTTPLTQDEQIDQLGRYKYGWADVDTAGASARRGINEEVVTDISASRRVPVSGWRWRAGRASRAGPPTPGRGPTTPGAPCTR